MNPLRSVGGRLSIALLLVVAGALGIAYLVVVPRLENQLVDAKFSQLKEDGGIWAAGAAQVAAIRAISGDPVDWGEQANLVSASMQGARIVFFEPAPGDEPTRIVSRGDSAPSLGDVSDDELAIAAIPDMEYGSKRVRRLGKEYAEVVFPPPQQFTVDANPSPWMLVSAPLSDTAESVALVQRRLVYAGLIALAIALAVGFVAARVFARRIHRLERAADRIAAGQFDQPLVDTADDELGELARAFDRMRQRLAHLEHARREFIANASHELRTPLFALAGLLELLVDEDLDEETRREFLTTAREQSDRLTRLATGLLDLSRLDAGRLHVEHETVELDALAEVLADEFRAVAQASDHPLEVLGASASAVADELRVLQIGRVLVENALLHTPSGTQLRVRTRSHDGRALLSVEDDGQGIPAEHADHVFERFYRVNGEVTSGSGLGLAIARELAELMGGQIEFESRPGRTVFTLSLPAAVLPRRAGVA